MDRPTFSQSWSRVSRLTPTLRPHVQIHRQLYRGEPWHVVHDPISNNFFRLNPVAHHFVGLLDGRRSIDDCWRLTLERYGDDAPTQHEVIGLLGQLNQSNLLRVDLPTDAEPLLKRARQRRLKHWGGQAMSILFVRIPIFNPDRMLNWMLPLVRPILNKWFLMLWAAWLIFCLYQFIPHLREFIHESRNVLDPNNWAWMIVLFIVTKALHEFGHGIVCKRLGGSVPEMGIMMLVLFPAPFVDATSSWNFPTKWKRLVVAAAGMIFELALAGAAAVFWVHADDGIARQIAYNTVFLASVSTLLFNGNPLLRFDGYYMLSDLLEVPNLYDRSKKHLYWMVQRFAYGIKNATLVSTSFSEQCILTIYGIAASIYKVLILFGIILFVSGQLLTLGLLLAAWSFFAWMVIPVGKLVHWLATNPILHEHRARAIGVTVGFVALVLILVGAIPMEEHRRAQGIVESLQRTDITVQTDGFVTEVHAQAGDHVRKGQILFVADNIDLSTTARELEGEIKALQAAQRQSLSQEVVMRQMNQAKIVAVQEELDELKQRIERLVVRSPQDGILISEVPTHQLIGQYLTRGDVPARVLDAGNVRITALIDQTQNASPFFSEIQRVEIRTAGNIPQALQARLLRVSDAGRMELPHPALGYHGGGTIPTDYRDPHGQTTVRPQFEIWLGLPDELPPHMAVKTYPGQRVFVRFTLPKRPLMAQWVHRLRQLFRDRLAI